MDKLTCSEFTLGRRFVGRLPHGKDLITSIEDFCKASSIQMATFSVIVKNLLKKLRNKNNLSLGMASLGLGLGFLGFLTETLGLGLGFKPETFQSLGSIDFQKNFGKNC